MASCSPRIAFSLVFASICITLLHATNTCGPGQALYGNRCYQTYRPGPRCNQDFSFAAANQFCQANGGQLASIRNQTMNDWVTALIRRDQHNQNQRSKCSSCPSSKRDYLYWIGLQLTHSANGSVNGSSWTDGSAVTYGNPLSQNFRPPFVTGQPQGTIGDGSVPGEVCPLGNENACVAMYGYGQTVGKWTTRNCSNSHSVEVSCSCSAQQNNTTAVINPHQHENHHSSSSSEEEDQVDECRDEAALNGFVCEYCPVEWSPFQGHCYLAVPGTLPMPNEISVCTNMPGVSVASAHSDAENEFIANLAVNAGIDGSILAGMQLTYNTNTFEAPPVAANNIDGSPADYGNPLIAPWTTKGTYPWAPANGLAYPAQPDNRPPPADCVVMWVTGSGHPIGTWDDIACNAFDVNGVVCEM